MVKESELIHQLGSLATQLVKCRKEREKNSRILFVLKSTPHEYHASGSLVSEEDTLKVQVTLPNDKVIELPYEYHYKSNYAHEGDVSRIEGDENKELRQLEGQSTLIILAYLIQIYGKPLKVWGTYSFHSHTSGQDEKDEEWNFSFKFP